MSKPPILEAAPLQVRPGQSLAFEAAFAKAQAIIASMPGYRSHELQRCLERDGHYLLLVRWDSVADHEEGFRKSPQYQEWKRLLHHFYDPFPTVNHYEVVVSSERAPYHAHIYYEPGSRGVAESLRRRLTGGSVLYVGEMRDHGVGPHPKPQFEIHFYKDALPAILPIIEASGLTALVHPLTDDDVADHTSLATWIGAPLKLDLSVLDPPGVNQGIPRFGKTDF